MKMSLPWKKNWLLSVCSFLQFGILSLSYAQTWTNQYYGTPQFNISDDDQITLLQNSIQVLNQKIHQLQNQIEDGQLQKSKVDKKIENKQGQISQINHQIASKVNERQNLVNQKNQLEQQLQNGQTLLANAEQKVTAAQNALNSTQNKKSNLEAKLVDAKEAQRAANLAKATAEQTKDFKKSEYESLLARCMNGPNKPTKEVCDQRPAVASALNAFTTAQLDFRAKSIEFEVKSNAVEQLIAQVAQAVSDVATATQNLQNAQAAVVTLKNQLVSLPGQIASINQQIQNLNQQVAQLTLSKNELENDLQSLGTEQVQWAQHIQSLKQNQVLSLNQKQQLENQRDQRRAEVIQLVLTANHHGYNRALIDGAREGLEVAQSLGVFHGEQDGRIDGDQAGQQAGQDRDFQKGHQQGYSEGFNQGTNEGSAQGYAEGTQAGNSLAGEWAGIQSGESKANLSDASSVGASQGEAAGYDRAIKTGLERGRPQGELEGVQSYETKELHQVQLQGPFAGTFTNSVPAWPGLKNLYYNTQPAKFYKHPFQVYAYIDGYQVGYQLAVYQEYHRVVGDFYQNAYQVAYSQAYNFSFSRPYPASLQAGLQQGKSDGFQNAFGPAKSQAFESAKKHFTSSPNTSSSEYQQSFAWHESQTYQKEYENIRLRSYRLKELQTFDENIVEQTQLAKNARREEVQAVYAQFPVLKFESSSVVDAGVGGVASLDGIFQPGERVVHSLVIKNFSDVDASGLVVKLSSGQELVLPLVPATSLVTVNGALENHIPLDVKVGQQVSIQFGLRFELASAEKSLQGRHFEQVQNNFLKIAEKKVLRVDYPLEISGLNLAGSLELNKPVALNAQVVNRSTRAHAGPISIVLTASTVTPLVAKEFSVLTNIKTSVNVTGAELLLRDEIDALKNVRISARLEQNGVLLGFLKNDLTTVSRVGFVARPNAPVIVFENLNTLNEVQTIINSYEGIGQVSVLDLGLNGTQQAILDKGFTRQVVYLVPSVDSDRDLTTKLSGLLRNSDHATLVFFDQYGQGLANALKYVPELATATKLQLNRWGNRGLVNLYSSNQVTIPGAKSAQTLFQASSQSLELLKSVVVAPLLQSSDELINKMLVSFDVKRFNALQEWEREAVQLLSIRSVQFMQNLNQHFKLTGSKKAEAERLVKEAREIPARLQAKMADKNLPLNQRAVATFLSYHIAEALNYAEGDYTAMKNEVDAQFDKQIDVLEDKNKSTAKDVIEKGLKDKSSYSAIIDIKDGKHSVRPFTN